MKALLFLFCCLPVLAAPRYRSLRVAPEWAPTNMMAGVVEVAAGETLEVVSLESAMLLVQWPDSGQGNAAYYKLPLVVSGPAKVTCAPFNLIDSYRLSAFITVRILPDVADPNTSVILVPGTNSVTVNLESSTNLVDWSVSASVTLTNVPAATFFRAKVASAP
jgi:hypothetical protein